MERLNCKFCHRTSHEFTILKCDHVVCAECLWGEIKASLQGTSSIRCPCGQVSNFISKSILTSPLATAQISSNGSPRRYSSAKRPTRVQTLAMSRRKQQVADKMRMTSSSGRKDELGRELQFLGIQFRKSVEQVQRNFKVVMEAISKRYQTLVGNIRLFWLEEIVQPEPLQVLNVSKLFERKYHKAVGHKLKHLNESLLESLSNVRMNTVQYETIEPQLLKEGKQNKSRLQNCRFEREKLLKTIQQLKEEGRGLKKMGRKSSKVRFL